MRQLTEWHLQLGQFNALGAHGLGAANGCRKLHLSRQGLAAHQHIGLRAASLSFGNNQEHLHGWLGKRLRAKSLM